MPDRFADPRKDIQTSDMPTGDTQRVQNFWNVAACGTQFVADPKNDREFFEEYCKFRYATWLTARTALLARSHMYIPAGTRGNYSRNSERWKPELCIFPSGNTRWAACFPFQSKKCLPGQWDGTY
jgi:hypothetical protein